MQEVNRLSSLNRGHLADSSISPPKKDEPFKVFYPPGYNLEAMMKVLDESDAISQSEGYYTANSLVTG